MKKKKLKKLCNQYEDAAARLFTQVLLESGHKNELINGIKDIVGLKPADEKYWDLSPGGTIDMLRAWANANQTEIANLKKVLGLPLVANPKPMVRGL